MALYVIMIIRKFQNIFGPIKLEDSLRSSINLNPLIIFSESVFMLWCFCYLSKESFQYTVKEYNWGECKRVVSAFFID